MRVRSALVVLAAASVATGCATAAGQEPQAAPAPDGDRVARTAIYEVFVRSFSPEGNLRGVVAGLDRIHAVGAEVVWLMPIQPNGVLNRKGPLGSPYSIRDYRAIAPHFGSEEDFRQLVRAVHARGMKLVIDWVPNHTAWDHAWVSEHPEFYTRNERGEMTHPRNNEGELTDWTDVAELDYDNPELRRAMVAEMRYWLEEFGIDGFRVDMAGMVPYDFWREAVPQLRAVRPLLLIAEWEDPRMHELGFDLTYSWAPYHRLKAVWKGEPASTWLQAVQAELRAMPEGGLRMRFTTNHDETAWDETPLGLFGGAEGARAAFVAVALLPGPPLIYNGQEVESPQRLRLFYSDPVEWGQRGADAARDFYRRVIELSRTHEAFTSGEFEAVETDLPADVIAYRRGGALVLVNTRSLPLQVSVRGPTLRGSRDLLSGAAQAGDTVSLASHGAVVLDVAGQPPD